MGHWIKYYKDGSQYVGDDIGVRRKEKSWRNSKNTDIRQVCLCHNQLELFIVGEGEYWQSDTWEADISTGRSFLIKRRIMKKILSSDSLVYIQKTRKRIAARFPSLVDTKTGQDIPRILNSGMVGQWLVLEMDVPNGSVETYLSTEKI